MDQTEIEQIVEGMSEADKAAVLGTEFPVELEKEAAAELAETDLVDALYAYGAMTADYELEATDGELNKEAAADMEAAEQEISEAIEESVVASGLDQVEDEVELHKKAQASAAIIFQGYCDQIEKVAGIATRAKQVSKLLSSKAKAGMKVAKKGLNKGVAAAKDAGAAAGKHVKKNKSAYMAAAGGAALGAGAMAAKKHMDKKASELTIDELTVEVLNRMDAVEVVEEGIDKLAGLGAKAAKKAKSLLSKGQKHIKAHGKKYLAGGAGAATGALAMHMKHRSEKK